MKRGVARNVVRNVVKEVVTTVVGPKGVPYDAILAKSGFALLTKDDKYIIVKH
ncbi:hypothetical protein LCGC14_1425210 [marine sediment metagenome]|uniref:Uncharacterized protein n=1 Tax=marine sediment metagenome TaxID=412755 RepID=A0A0F9KBA7_9ZZZZ